MTKNNDAVDSLLRNLKGQLPEPRLNLSDVEKDQLIKTAGGVGTVKNIIAAKKSYKLARIPFLFNSIDTQAVVDILANDMAAAIARSS